MSKSKSDEAIVSEIWEAFYSAWSVVHCKTLSDGEWIDNISLLTSFKRKPLLEFWKKWPGSPTPFSMYFRVGDSALQTSLMFADFVSGELKNACIQSVGKFFPKVIRHRDENEIHEWREAFYRNISDKLIRLSAPERFQAKEMLWHAIQAELEQSKTKQVGVSRRDVGVALGLAEEFLSDFVTRFSKAKSNTAKSIGKDPIDPRANLYELFPILDDLEKFSRLKSSEKTRLKRHLSQLQREPKR